MTDDSVAEGVESLGPLGLVEPGGNPIIHSTNDGHRRPIPSPPVSAGVGDRSSRDDVPATLLASSVVRWPVRAAVPRDGLPALGLSFSPPTPLIPFWLDP